MLSNEAIVRAVRTIRFSSKGGRHAHFLPSMRGLAKTAGISRQTAYTVAATGKMSPETRQLLTWALLSLGVVQHRA